MIVCADVASARKEALVNNYEFTLPHCTFIHILFTQSERSANS